MDNADEMLGQGSQVAVGEQETETLPPMGSAASEHFQQLAASVASDDAPSGEEDTHAKAIVDGGDGADDSASEPSKPSFDADAMRLEQVRQTARQFNVPEQVVTSFRNSGEGEMYLHGLRSQMLSQGATPPDQGGNGAQKPTSLPALDFQLGEELDPAIAGNFGKLNDFRTGISDRFAQAEQNQQLIVNALVEMNRQNQQAAEMQQNAMLDASIGGLDAELKSVFTAPGAKDKLLQEMRVLDAGARAIGAQRSFDELFRGGVSLIASDKMKEIERDRLAGEQKKRARGATPRPSSAKTTERDMSPTDQSKDAMMRQQAILAQRFDR